MKYLVLGHKVDSNSDIYWTDDYREAHEVFSSSDYHSYTVVETAEVETHSN